MSHRQQSSSDHERIELIKTDTVAEKAFRIFCNLSLLALVMVMGNDGNRRGRYKLSPVQIDQLVKYYIDGLKISDIALKMGVSVSTVTRVMRRLREQTADKKSV